MFSSACAFSLRLRDAVVDMARARAFAVPSFPRRDDASTTDDDDGTRACEDERRRMRHKSLVTKTSNERAMTVGENDGRRSVTRARASRRVV